MPSSFLPTSLLPPLAAGFIAVLVGYTSSVALIFQAGISAGASIELIGAWLGALALGMGLSTIGLSLYYKHPVMVAWSTPGAALLATSLVGVPLPQAIGAFVVTGLLITLVGVTGVFERMMNKLPLSIASALLAGVLARFALDAVLGVALDTALVLIMFASYLIAKRISARYAMLVVLFVGLVACFAMGVVKTEHLQLQFATPQFIAPEFSVQSVVGVALPLFIVTMASQNIPGVATQRACGYQTPISPVIATTGVFTTLLAPFGAYALNLAAITAAICMGEQAHPDKDKRYWAAVACGCFYLVIAVLGAAVAGLLAALPKTFVLALAGLALLGTIGNGLAAAMKDESSREAALLTFLVTLSGVSLLGLGSAFWGLLAGLIALLVLKPRPH